MFFGSYLVSKKIISLDALLKALIEQQESSESSIKILLGEKSITEEDILKVLNYQSSNSSTFLKSCLELKIITDEEFSIAQLKMAESRPTLGEILVRNNSISVEDISKAFDEFKSAPVADEPDSSPKQDNDDNSISAAALESLKELGHDTSELESRIPKEITSDEGGISAAALESLKELGHDTSELESQVVSSSVVEDSHISAAALESLKEIGGVSEEELKELEAATPSEEKVESSGSNSTFISEFLDTYNEKLNKKMNKVISMIYSTAESKSDVANIFNTLYRELHVIKGAACLAEAKVTEKLISLWEVVIEDLFKKDNDFLVNWVGTNLPVLEESIDIIWDIRASIEANDNELGFWSNEDKKAKYTQNMKKIKEISVI